MIYCIPTMGFPGAYGIGFPVAIFRAALTLMWMKHVLVSIVNLLLGRGWESPSLRMLSSCPLYLGAFEAPDATSYGIICPLDTGMRAAEVRASIPVVRFRDISNKKFANNDEQEDPQCSVCLCDFTAADNVRQTPLCSHVFHKDCLDRWMAHHQTTCPLCRSSLTPELLEHQSSHMTLDAQLEQEAADNYWFLAFRRPRSSTSAARRGSRWGLQYFLNACPVGPTGSH